MALLNKRSRNIEGLLANRLTGGGTDRGTHGYNMGNKTFYDTKGQEGKNFLKAIDRYHNKDDWNKDLGGGQNFMQGPTGDSSDYVDPLMKIGAARKKLLEDPENELDRNEMDSEALDYFQQDQAADVTERLDKLDKESLGPDHMDQRGTQIDEVTGKYLGDNPFGVLGEKVSGAYDSVKDWFSSDDEEGGGKKKKPMSKEAMKYGADLMKGMMQEPSQGQRQMPTSKVTRGSVPFAGLLAQKAPRQRNPYFTPKGLV